jgi:hypothetical protein
MSLTSLLDLHILIQLFICPAATLARPGLSATAPCWAIGRCVGRCCQCRLCARISPFFGNPVLMFRCERLLRRVPDALWRGRGETAIEMVRTHIASLKREVGLLPRFYGLCASTAVGAAT